jgi:hypothetical protein
MNTYADQTEENKSESVASAVSQMQTRDEPTFEFMDSRSEAVAQRKLQHIADGSLQVSQLKSFQEMADNSFQAKEVAQLQLRADTFSGQQHPTIQREENDTGLPDNLKTGMENLTGHSMDDVKVHRNSDKPAQLNAHAYAQGTDIHLAPGQEKHLPHELGHVVQQKEGRVKPTKQLKGQTNINDDAGLEKEADVFGAKALFTTNVGDVNLKKAAVSKENIQLNAAVNEDSGPSMVETHGMGNELPFADSEPLSEEQKDEFIKDQNRKSFKAAYDPMGSLQGLANALFKSPEGADTLNDQFLVDIIKNPFESNWFKAKKCLTTDFWPDVMGALPTHGASIGLMQALVDMRGRVWDRFVKQVQPNIEKAVEEGRQLPGFENIENPDKIDDNFRLADSVGSESVTSDIDLSAKGENTEIGVSMINTAFNAQYGTEPGAFFDINVYSSDWMFKPKELSAKGAKNIVMAPTSEAMDTTKSELNPENQKRKDDRNEVWSMVKIRRNMTQDDWDTYKEDLLLGIEDNQTEKDETLIKFSEVDAEYTTFYNTVERETNELKKAVNFEEKQQNSAFKDKNGKDRMGEEALEMQASNIEYEKIILEVKRLRLEIKELQKEPKAPRATIEELLLKVHDGVARGLTYANEVYATEGAVLNTVLGDQGAVKKLKEKQAEDSSIESYTYQLSKEQYLQAVNENVGDTLHSLKHNEEDPQYAVYRAGKYIARLCSATTKLINPTEPSSIAGYDTLSEIGEKSVEEKALEAGSDPLAVRNNNSFFSQYEIGDLSVVKSLTISLGSRASALYKTTKT